MMGRRTKLSLILFLIILVISSVFYQRQYAIRQATIKFNIRILYQIYFHWARYQKLNYGSRPEFDNPIFSWRFYVFQLDASLCNKGYNFDSINFQKPWNSPENKSFFNGYIFYNIFHLRMKYNKFMFPSIFDPEPNMYQSTSVMAVTGTNTAWDKEIYHDCEHLDEMLDKRIDGQIIFVSVRNTDVHWAQPGDLSIEDFAGDKMPPEIGEEEFYVVFQDSEIRLLKGSTPTSAIRAFLTVDQAKKNDRDKVLGPYTIILDQRF